MENNLENSDDELTLPADTLNILQEFLREKQEREKLENEIISAKEPQDVEFEENWQLSQFWYSESTKLELSTMCANLIARAFSGNENIQIGLLSCPSLYKSVKKVHENVKIFEFDQRFSAFGDDFEFYDYTQADSDAYLDQFCEYFDIIIADPPFLSDECIAKMSTIIKKIAKPTTKIILCSGETVTEWAAKYLNLNMCKYQPKHNRNLGNEFVAFANFDLDNFI